MNKLIQTILLVLVGLVVLTAAGPILIKLTGALVTPILVGGIVAALIRCVWFYTR